MLTLESYTGIKWINETTRMSPPQMARLEPHHLTGDGPRIAGYSIR